MTRNLFSCVHLCVCSLLLLVGCNLTSEPESPMGDHALEYGVYQCGAEFITEENGQSFFPTDQVAFFNQASRTNQFAYEGEWSSEVGKDQQFGMTLVLKDVQPGNCIEASVYRHVSNRRGALFITSTDATEVFSFTHHATSVEKDGWEKLYLKVTIKPEFEGRIKIFLGSRGQDLVYFDNLEVKWSEKDEYPVFAADQAINLNLSDSVLDYWNSWRDSSFQDGQISKKLKDYQFSSMLWQGNESAIRVRVKGDWLDHIQGRKWSYRVKIDDDEAVEGMRTFSLQNAETRSYLDEWLLHKFYEHTDVLTTRYGFIPLNINAESRGVYAYEEHFTKQLIESSARREGPILKINEDPFWKRVKAAMKGKTIGDHDFPLMDMIEPFGKGRTRRSKNLSSQFEQGSQLLEQFRSGIAPVSELFDLDRLARYYAILDIGQVEHGCAWHNQRWYYNPVTARLEPIAYDLYGGQIEEDEDAIAPFYARFSSAPDETLAAEEYFMLLPFNDDKFVRLYKHYLDSFSHPDFLADFLSKVRPQMEEYQALLLKESPFPYRPERLSAPTTLFV